jgi:hypothetical protein
MAVQQHVGYAEHVRQLLLRPGAAWVIGAAALPMSEISTKSLLWILAEAVAGNETH